MCISVEKEGLDHGGLEREGEGDEGEELQPHQLPLHVYLDGTPTLGKEVDAKKLQDGIFCDYQLWV